MNRILKREYDGDDKPFTDNLERAEVIFVKGWLDIQEPMSLQSLNF